MNKEKVWKWLKTALMAAVGGGIAACIAALFDPAKFSLAKDLGSGKEWTFFLQGFAVTFGALLIKSPFGQEMIATYQKSQKALAESQGEMQQAKSTFQKGAKNGDAVNRDPAAPEEQAKGTLGGSGNQKSG